MEGITKEETFNLSARKTVHAIFSVNYGEKSKEGEDNSKDLGDAATHLRHLTSSSLSSVINFTTTSTSDTHHTDFIRPCDKIITDINLSQIKTPELPEKKAKEFIGLVADNEVISRSNLTNPTKYNHQANVSVTSVSTSRKRRIHANSVTCFGYADQKESISALTNGQPFGANITKSPYTKPDRLQPTRPRIRKRSLKTQITETESLNKQSQKQPRLCSTIGFQKASSVYNSFGSSNYFSADNNSIICDTVSKSKCYGRSGFMKKQCNAERKNQKTISNYFTVSSRKNKMADDEKLRDRQDIIIAEYNEVTKPPSLPSTPSKMYSTIKQVSPSVYISSPQEKMECQKSYPERPTTDAVKKLFEGQKNCTTSQTKPSTKKRKHGGESTVSNKKLNVPLLMETSPIIADFMDSDDSDLVDVDLKSISCVNKTFGLLESSDMLSQPCNTTFFEILPLEVIETIFCQLPILDLCLNCNRVCKQWNNIISNDTFLYWKKTYFKGLVDEDSNAEVQRLLSKTKMKSPGHFIKQFILYMKDFKPFSFIGENMISCLKEHPMFNTAEKLITEYTPECIKEKMCNPWSIIACIVILSRNVTDVELILKSLLITTSQCLIKDLLECFYCMATLCNGMMKQGRPDVWYYLHYRLFYTLYLYENASVSDHGMLKDAIKEAKGQQTLLKYGDSSTNVRLTHEQLRIIKYNPQDKEVIKIVAFAGTGKTTTLVRYTQLRPNLKFLLVVYNKSVCEHAKTKFPHNVTVKTGHGLAFGVTGRKYAAAKKLNSYGLKVYSVAMALPPRKGENLYVRAKFVLETLNNFLASADSTITTEHTPTFQKNDAGQMIPINEDFKSFYVEEANFMWKKMKDYNDKQVGMTHDGYLKLYQLYNPVLSGYDIILIDEAQDLTPTVIDVLEKQRQTKILVGDPHQQIYSFRGAVNAMHQIQSTKTFYLTQSFRFGPEIAHIAACCLRLLKNVKDKTLVGHGKPGFITGETVGQLAIISRCNFTLFSEAVKKCCYSNNPTLKVGFVGGTNGIGFPILQDIYKLMISPEDRVKDRKIENKFIARFSNIGDLEKYATKAMDHELLGKIRIVRTYNHNLPSHINRILEKSVKDLQVADIVLSTAHKSKGLEFSTVRVTDDFNYLGPGSSINFGPGPIPHDESNLLYVAVTRAKNALLMSPDILKILKESGMRFETPVLSEELKNKNIPFTCKITGADFTPKLFTIQKQDVKLGCGTLISGGLLSPQILYEDGHAFKDLCGEKPTENQNRERHPGHWRHDDDDDDNDDDDDEDLIQIPDLMWM